jgi:hypothetical protein
MLSSKWFYGIYSLTANVSEYSLCSILISEYSPLNMKLTECSETLSVKLQTPVNHPEESIRHSERNESLGPRIIIQGVAEKSDGIMTCYIENFRFFCRTLYNNIIGPPSYTSIRSVLTETSFCGAWLNDLCENGSTENSASNIKMTCAMNGILSLLIRFLWKGMWSCFVTET